MDEVSTGGQWYLQSLASLKRHESLPLQPLQEACVLIVRLSRALYFPFRTAATAMVYFQYFYARQSLPHMALFERYPPKDLALTALFLAAKAEETHKKLVPFLQAAFIVLNPNWNGGNVEDVRISEEHRMHVTKYEHVILTTIDFHFHTIHPHEIVAALVPFLTTTTNIAKDDERLSTMFNFLRECYLFPQIILAYPPEIVAFAGLRHVFGAISAEKLGLDSKMEAFADAIVHFMSENIVLKRFND